MHASIEQLLSLRDTDAPPSENGGAGQHVHECAACRAQLRALQQRRDALRALPELQPQSDPWASIAARAAEAEAKPSRSHSQGAWWSLGLAASLVMAMLVALLWSGEEPGAPEQLVFEQPETRAATRDLVAESQRLEQMLRSVSHQPRVVNAGTADTIAQLEDRIALLDYGLSLSGGSQLTAAEANALWQQRVDLMNSLVQVRTAQARRVDF